MEILDLALKIILFLISLFLILLVLVQLPKKDAGLGTAFGGGTTDALFGAGAGNVLTPPKRCKRTPVASATSSDPSSLASALFKHVGDGPRAKK